jgi:hypothetical protein
MIMLCMVLILMTLVCMVLIFMVRTHGYGLDNASSEGYIIVGSSGSS